MIILIEITYMNSHIHNIIKENSTFIVHLPLQAYSCGGIYKHSNKIIYSLTEQKWF